MDAENSIPPPVPSSRADYIGERLEAIKAYSNERAEKDKAIIEEMMRALEPFAVYASAVHPTWPDSSSTCMSDIEGKVPRLSLGDCRKARSLLSRAKEAGYG